MKLYIDPRSSSCLRVLTALTFKGALIERVVLDLSRGEQKSLPWSGRNVAGLLPVLELEKGELLTQSMAIIEWLESYFPEPRSIPDDALERARMRELCSLVASDWHVLASLRLRRALTLRLHMAEEEAASWSRQWSIEGLAAVEQILTRSAGKHAVGNAITMADFFVVPALFNAERAGIDLSEYPIAENIYETAMRHPVFQCVNQQRSGRSSSDDAGTST